MGVGKAAMLNVVHFTERYTRARELLTASAEQGMVEAMERLVSMYEHGKGVDYNLKEAAKWQKKCVAYYRNIVTQEASTILVEKLVDALLYLAEITLNTLELDESEKAFNEAENICKNDRTMLSDRNTKWARCWCGLGSVWLRRWQLEQSEACTRKAVQICSMNCHINRSSKSLYLSAITHGHPLGYLPAAVLTHILNRIVFPREKQMTLPEIIDEAVETTRRLFAGTDYLDDLCAIIDKAVRLAANHDTDRSNIRQLGGGWVAEETLAIAIYCALRYEHDFSAGIIAAVNHDGDSDSTGAVTGNILGAINGYDSIKAKWKNHLELMDVLLEMSDDLCQGCLMSEYDTYYDPDWSRKYIDIRWKSKR